MARPTNRTEFKDYCLRALGFPVLKMNLAPEQIEDRIDEALKYYWDYHFDGMEKIYYKHQVTAQDKINKYITLPQNINGVVNIFNFGSIIGSMNMFDLRYQIALNDLYVLTSTSMIPYYISMQHIQEMEYLLVGKKPIRYNRHTNKCYLDMDWNYVEIDNYLLIEAYEVIDPDVYTDAWNDRWLLEYCTALIKRQWGTNLKKYDNIMMAGTTKFNGQKIFDEAEKEIKELREEMLYSYSSPAIVMYG